MKKLKYAETMVERQLHTTFLLSVTKTFVKELIGSIKFVLIWTVAKETSQK